MKVLLVLCLSLLAFAFGTVSASANTVTGIAVNCGQGTVTVSVTHWHSAGDVVIRDHAGSPVVQGAPHLNADGAGSITFNIGALGGNGAYTAGHVDSELAQVAFTVACEGGPSPSPSPRPSPSPSPGFHVTPTTTCGGTVFFGGLHGTDVVLVASIAKTFGPGDKPLHLVPGKYHWELFVGTTDTQVGGSFTITDCPIPTLPKDGVLPIVPMVPYAIAAIIATALLVPTVRRLRRR